MVGLEIWPQALDIFHGKVKNTLTISVIAATTEVEIGYVRLDNQSIERDRVIGIGFVLDFVEFILFTFGDKEMISVIEALRESSFQNIRPRRFLRSGSQSNGGCKKSCQNSKYGSDLGQITSPPKKGATNVGNTSKSTSMMKTTVTSSMNDNIITSNSYFALNAKEEDEEEYVENVYDESANLFPNTKTSGSSSFTVAAG
ncbi:hypothetical protein Tco_1111977 [Tanacetum coccineum]|uniref:Uncharacterized protein n=1 Tax=Tanacetum coccineum TaxID=301880 RepID=A0ABQ5INH1_9ASTR